MKNILLASLLLWITAILVVTIFPGIVFGPLLVLVGMAAFHCSWPGLLVLVAALSLLRIARLRPEGSWLGLSLSGLVGVKLSLFPFEQYQGLGEPEEWAVFPLLAVAASLVRHRRRLQSLFRSWHSRMDYDFLSDRLRISSPENQAV